MLVAGTYTMEQKITVEWEYAIAVEKLVDLIGRLPHRTYQEDEIRTFISGYLRRLDDTLPSTKISDYRISRGSLALILDALENAQALRRASGDDTRRWTLGPTGI